MSIYICIYTCTCTCVLGALFCGLNSPSFLPLLSSLPLPLALPPSLPLPPPSHRLLCSVVDNIEHLIDEWFPGLRDIDTSSGRDLVCPMALCPQCPSEWGRPNMPHMYRPSVLSALVSGVALTCHTCIGPLSSVPQ